jgi:DNA-binding beta-propeller fold protein YncE
MTLRRVLLAVALLAMPAFSYRPRICAYRCSDDSCVAKIQTDALEEAMPVLWNSQLNDLYVTGYDYLYAVDCSTDTTVDTEFGSFGATGDPALDSTDNKLYCPSWQDMVVYDCNAESVVATIPLPYYFSGHVVWSPMYNKVYMSFDLYRSCVMAIDCRADTVLKYIPIVGGAEDMCARGSDKVYFAGDHSIGVIDVATDSFIGRIHLPDTPTWLALNPVTDRLVIQDWWDGTFVYDCVGDTLVDSLPYNVAGFGGIDVRKNHLYLCLTDGLCTVDLETGSVLDTLLARRVSSMALDTTDNKAYVLMEGSDSNDTIWVVDTDSGQLLRVLQTGEYSTLRAVWNPQMNKVYVGAYSPVPSVEQPSIDRTRRASSSPAVSMGAASVRRLGSCIVFDVMGRRVANLRSGVFFVREAQAQAVRKVVIQR